NVFAHPIVERMNEGMAGESSMELIVNNEPYLVNAAKLGMQGLVVVAQIEKKQVMAALNMLLNKTLLMAGLVLGLSIAIGVLFATHLTSNVEHLNDAALELGNGNLDAEIKVHSHDEIGVVANSFVTMREKIKGLLVETAHKAQLEEELRTAQLVQNTIL